jgi:hypothetical protein
MAITFPVPGLEFCSKVPLCADAVRLSGKVRMLLWRRRGKGPSCVVMSPNMHDMRVLPRIHWLEALCHAQHEGPILTDTAQATLIDPVISFPLTPPCHVSIHDPHVDY